MPGRGWWGWAGAALAAVGLAVVGGLALQIGGGEGDVAEKGVLSGRWQVVYADTALGSVEGIARIDEEEGRAEVVFQHPETGAEHRLVSTVFRREGARLTLELEGRHPRSAHRDGHGYPDQAVVIPATAARISVTTAPDSEVPAAVAPRRESDLDRLDLELEVGSRHRMMGVWSYRADPVTRRDRAGFGRVGTFTELEDGRTLQRGWEVWYRLPPTIVGAFALDDQLLQGVRMGDGHIIGERPAFPHPFQGTIGPESDRKRRIYIFGVDIPQNRRDGPVEIEPLAPGVEYGKVLFAEDAFQMPTLEGAAAQAQINPFARGRQMLLDDQEEVGPGAAAMEALVVEVKLTDELLPGYQPFALNGQVGAWLLQFGDNRATIRFVREVDPELPHNQGQRYDVIQDVFLPEVVRLEARTALRLEVDVIHATVGRNAKVQKMGTSPRVPLYRTAENPRLYRSAPIQVQPLGPDLETPLFSPVAGDPGQAARLAAAGSDAGVYYLPAAAGDVLYAALVENGLISFPPVPARADVHTTPWRIVQRQQGSPSAAADVVSYAWKDFMVQAAECHDLTIDTDWDRPNYEYVDEVNSYLLWPAWWFDPSQGVYVLGHIQSAVDGARLSVAVQLGDHVAMLLMRRTYLDMMEQAIARTAAVQSDEDLVAFWLRHQPLGEAPVPVFSDLDVEVQGPGGRAMPFYETYLHDDAQGFLSRPRFEAAPPWVAPATRKAIAAYLALMRESVTAASEVGPCDAEKLLELTGSGFETVQERLNSRLVRLEEDGRSLRWVPDEVARLRVDMLADKFESHFAFERLAAADNDALLTMVAGTVGAALGPAGAAGIVGGAAFDFALGSGVSYYRASAAQAEIDFAKGSYEVLGHTRYEHALANDYTLYNWGTEMITSAAVGAGINIAFEGLLRVFRAVPRWAVRYGVGPRRWRAEEGARILREHGFDPHAVPESLPLRARENVAEYIMEAGRMRRAGAVLDDNQLRVLGRLDAAEAQASQARRAIAAIDDDAQRTLGPVLDRPDVTALLAAAGDQVGMVLRRADGGREIALDVLLHRPVRSIEELGEAVRVRLDTRRSAGDALFAQSRVTEREIVEGLKQEQWRFLLLEKDGGLSIAVRDPDDAVGTLWVEYDGAVYAFGAEGRVLPAVRPGIRSQHLVGIDEADGMPVDMYMHFRAMDHFGIRFGGGLESVRMKNVLDPDLVAHLEWYRARHHPGRSLEQLADEGLLEGVLRNSEAMQKVDELLRHAGFEIESIRVDMAGARRVPIVGRDLGGDLDTLRSRFGLDEEATGLAGFDAEIKVRPRGGSDFRSRPTEVVAPAAGDDVDELAAVVHGRLGRLGMPEDSIDEVVTNLVRIKGYDADEAVVVAAAERGLPASRAREVTGLSDAEIRGILDRHIAGQGVADTAQRSSIIDDFLAAEVADTRVQPPPVAAEFRPRTPADPHATMAPPGDPGATLPPQPGRISGRATSPSRGADSLDDLMEAQRVALLDELRAGVPGTQDRLATLNLHATHLSSLSVAERQVAGDAIAAVRRLGVDGPTAIEYAILHARRRAYRQGPISAGQLAAESFLYAAESPVQLQEFAAATGLSSRAARDALEAAAEVHGIALLPGDEIRPLILLPPVDF